MKTLFEQGLELEKQGDYESALAIYLQEAELGNDEAECREGNIYRFGRGYRSGIGNYWSKFAELASKRFNKLCSNRN